ncbi:MAG: hypothetical protein HYS07_10855 [Chlamydiae bacterium]|nr:hypothetical protein [Chlamydiota bacterium]MBI3277963.1 hypothetical protein [Chlamydiota bacterium]
MAIEAPAQAESTGQFKTIIDPLGNTIERTYNYAPANRPIELISKSNGIEKVEKGSGLLLND